ncbi:MAG: Wzz/FepE/Etk N-terminal domain-containing protein [Desulfuromonadales bacterium]|nr:Wzz/FepE/Etk N-terminal domain-containing protein [Desulfuromonadales bacterium]
MGQIEKNDVGTYRNDEIDLVELFLILVRRKYLVLFVCLSFLILGAIYSFSKSSVYSYRTVIEIGTSVIKNPKGYDSMPIETSDEVVSNLNSDYIPRAVSFLSSKKNKHGMSAKASAKKNGNIVELTSFGGADEAEIYKELHDQAALFFLADHRDLILESLEVAVEDESLKLEKIDEQKGLLDLDSKRYSDLEIILKERIKKVELTLSQAQASYKKAVSDQSEARILVMINDQISRSTSQLYSLEERLKVELALLKSQLAIKYSDNKREFDEQKERLVALQDVMFRYRNLKGNSQLLRVNEHAKVKEITTHLKESGISSLALRSAKPLGTSKVLIVLVLGAVGVFVGVVFAFVFEFVAYARKRMELES